jgi:hypothetical protein
MHDIQLHNLAQQASSTGWFVPKGDTDAGSKRSRDILLLLLLLLLLVLSFSQTCRHRQRVSHTTVCLMKCKYLWF